jgi:hypothetical protein
LVSKAEPNTPLVCDRRCPYVIKPSYVKKDREWSEKKPEARPKRKPGSVRPNLTRQPSAVRRPWTQTSSTPAPSSERCELSDLHAGRSPTISLAAKKNNLTRSRRCPSISVSVEKQLPVGGGSARSASNWPRRLGQRRAEQMQFKVQAGRTAEDRVCAAQAATFLRFTASRRA